MAARWYVVNVYSGSEKKVAESLREQAVLKKMEDKILDVLVPTEEVVEIKKGAKVNSERKFFPGYILVKMEMSDECWHVVKNTPRVSGFLGSRNKPQPISDAVFWAAVINRSRLAMPKPNVSLNRWKKVLSVRKPLLILKSVSRFA